MFSFDDQMMGWMKRFGGRVEAFRELLSSRGLDGDEIGMYLHHHFIDLITKHRVVEWRDGADAAGGAVYEHAMTVDYAAFCHDLCLDALELSYLGQRLVEH